MKNFKIALAVLAAVSALAMSLSSCSKDNGPYYPVYNGLVTIKTTDSGVSYFQLDKKTTLEPTNWKNPYKREVRALLQYSEEPGGRRTLFKEGQGRMDRLGAHKKRCFL